MLKTATQRKSKEKAAWQHSLIKWHGRKYISNSQELPNSFLHGSRRIQERSSAHFRKTGLRRANCLLLSRAALGGRRGQLLPPQPDPQPLNTDLLIRPRIARAFANRLFQSMCRTSLSKHTDGKASAGVSH